MFDGSSIRGFQAIHESDMLLHARPDHGLLDPFRPAEDAGHELLHRTTRSPASPTAATRATSRAKARGLPRGTGIADTVYFGPEAEFYIFDDVRFETEPNEGYYYIDSIEGAWNTGRDEDGGNLGYKPRYKGGYFPVPPMDHYADLRDAMVRTLGRRRHRASRGRTTRSAPPARPRSTTVRHRCCTPATR